MKFTFYLLVLIFSTTTISCSKNKDDRKSKAADNQEAIARSCEISPSVGLSIEQLNPQLTTKSKIQTSFFDKKIDINKISPILQASMIATTEIIQKINTSLQLFKATPLGGCANFNNLSSLSGYHLNYWNELTEHDGPEVGYVMGLYKPYCGDWVPLSKLTSMCEEKITDTITIREDATRWTMVHEYLHYLFEEQRRKDNKREDKLFLDLERAYQDINVFIDHINDQATSHDPANWIALTETAEKIVEGNIELIKHFSAEEMTIETMLVDLYLNQELKYITQRDAQNALWYTVSSYNKAQKDIKYLTEFITQYQNAVKSSSISNHDKTNLTNQFSQMQKHVDALKNETELLKAKAQERAPQLKPNQTHKLVHSSSSDSVADQTSEPLAESLAPHRHPQNPYEILNQQKLKSLLN